jgi:hypothetical protein
MEWSKILPEFLGTRMACSGESDSPFAFILLFFYFAFSNA